MSTLPWFVQAVVMAILFYAVVRYVTLPKEKKQDTKVMTLFSVRL